MQNLTISKKIFIALIVFFSSPLFALAVNDLQISSSTDFSIASTVITAAAGGQVTNLNVQLNYIDITIDNLSTVTFSTAVRNIYFKIVKQSGSAAYTINPACPTNSVTLTGTGAQAVLRLQIQTTDPCATSTQTTYTYTYTPTLTSAPTSTPTPAPTPTPISTPKPIVTPATPPGCISTTAYSPLTGQKCPISALKPVVTPAIPPGCISTTAFSPLTGQKCPNYAVAITTVVAPAPVVIKTLDNKSASSILISNAIPSKSAGTEINSAATLILGMNNTMVRLLQTFLAKDKSIYPEGVITGYFGLLTLKAVKNFQCKHNIACGGDDAWGMVGPKTRAKINELTAGPI